MTQPASKSTNIIFQKQNILRLTDYLLLNAYSVNSVDLQNGKSGLALCLFEISRQLNNEKIENHAFELLQMSLSVTNQSEQIGFSKERAEIGFVLLYLIKNQFIDANFEEIFQTQTEKILSEINMLEPYSEKDLDHIYFLELLSLYKRDMSTIDLRNKILNDIAQSLENQFSDLLLSNYSKINNDHLLTIWNNYLKMTILSNDYFVPKNLLDKYLELYFRGRITGHWLPAYYLSNQQDETYKQISQTIYKRSIKGICLETMTLQEQINFSYILNLGFIQYIQYINLLEKDLLSLNHSGFEKLIIQKIKANNLVAGYNSGIARLLLYCVFRIDSYYNKDCSRFKYIF